MKQIRVVLAGVALSMFASAAAAQSFTSPVPNLGIPVPGDFTPPGVSLPNNVPNLGTTAPNLGIQGPGNLRGAVPNLGIRGPGNLTSRAPDLRIAGPDDMRIGVPDLRIPAPDLSQPHPPGSYPYDYRTRYAYNDYYSQQALQGRQSGQMGYGDYCVHYQPNLGNCRFNYVAPTQKNPVSNFRPENDASVYKRNDNFLFWGR